jgi:hypothetical protein
MKAVFKVFDALHCSKLFEIFWHILANISTLSTSEINAASSVLGTSSIRYEDVRVAEGRLLNIVFKFNRNRAFTTFHTINFPKDDNHSRSQLDIVVHELVHVYQFEIVGSIYIWQALRSQRTEGYDYGGWQQLTEDWSNGKHFYDYNREQQGQIAQDYYNDVLAEEILDQDPISQAYKPFIDELRNGEL